MIAHTTTSQAEIITATAATPRFQTALARTKAEVQAAQRLRYDVFVDEMGAGGAHVDHEQRLEQDRFDAFADHLLLRDLTRPAKDQVVGVYRLLTSDAAKSLGGFYSEGEFDLAPLINTGRPMLELGRSCLHHDYRGGAALMHLWQGLAEYVRANNVAILFGTASFPGTDLARLAGPLSWLHHTYLAPAPLRPTSKAVQSVPSLPIDQIDRLQAMRDTPALIKAYLRLGGVIGQGVYVDRAFNTTDVCMILDTADLRTDRTRLYSRTARPA